MMNAHGDTLSEKSIVDNALRLFKTMCFKLVNENEQELCIKVMPSRGNRDCLLDSACHSEVIRQLANSYGN